MFIKYRKDKGHLNWIDLFTEDNTHIILKIGEEKYTEFKNLSNEIIKKQDIHYQNAKWVNCFKCSLIYYFFELKWEKNIDINLTNVIYNDGGDEISTIDIFYNEESGMIIPYGDIHEMKKSIESNLGI